MLWSRSSPIELKTVSSDVENFTHIGAFHEIRIGLNNDQYQRLVEALEKARQAEVGNIQDITDTNAFSEASALSKIQDALAIQHSAPEQPRGMSQVMQGAFQGAFDANETQTPQASLEDPLNAEIDGLGKSTGRDDSLPPGYSRDPAALEALLESKGFPVVTKQEPADQITDKDNTQPFKMVFRDTSKPLPNGEMPTYVENTSPLDPNDKEAMEYYDPDTDLDAEPLPDAASVLDNEDRVFMGLPPLPDNGPLPNNGEISLPMPTAQEIADEFGLDIIEPSETSLPDPGQSENFFQRAAQGIKNVAKLAMPGSSGVEQAIADEYQLSTPEVIQYKWELQRSEEKNSSAITPDFFRHVQSAALDHGSMGQGEVISLELPDGHQISTWQDSVIISKELNGEPMILYEQDRETCHLPGNGETFSDKLSLEGKAAITAEVQKLDERLLADNFGVDIDSEPDQEISIFDMLSQPPGSVDMDSMDAVIARDTYGTAVEITTPGPERDANENKRFFHAVEKATLQQGELKEGFSNLDLGDGLTALAVPGDVVISRQDSTGNSSVLYEQSQDTAHLGGFGETHMDKLPKEDKSRIIGQIDGLTLAREASPIPGPKETQVSSKKSPVNAIPSKSKESKTMGIKEPAKQRRSKPSRDSDFGMGV